MSNCQVSSSGPGSLTFTPGGTGKPCTVRRPCTGSSLAPGTAPSVARGAIVSAAFGCCSEVSVGSPGSTSPVALAVGVGALVDGLDAPALLVPLSWPPQP